jgi:signal transduction histidine kinase
LDEALKIVADGDQGLIDCILLDLSLPDSIGRETYGRIQKSVPETPIIILSGNADHEIAVAMVKHGAQDYIPKDTLNGDLLKRSILYAVERQRLSMGMKKIREQLQSATRDLKITQNQLIQAEKLDSLGRLAAGVAHEVKNPLGVLQMGVDYFRQQSTVLNEMDETVLNYMQDAITRADTVIHEMLNFSRANDFDMRPLCANKLVRSALRMVNHDLLKKKIRVVQELAAALPETRGDEGKLQQVLINILINATQALQKGGQLDVRTFVSPVDAPVFPGSDAARERLQSGGPSVVIEVRDHGPGIPENVIGRIFEPFFTTKPRGEGTGLGLCVAQRILEIHGGHLEVANMTEPTGARFRIMLRAELAADSTIADVAALPPAEASSSSTAAA